MIFLGHADPVAFVEKNICVTLRTKLSASIGMMDNLFILWYLCKSRLQSMDASFRFKRGIQLETYNFS